MQTSADQLKRQQEILKGLGFYFGKIDGVWGPETIRAKKSWEADVKYVPGLPNNGLPLSEQKPYPAGITLDRETGLFSHPVLEKPAQAEAVTKK